MQKKGDKTRGAILQAARELFSEKGYAAVTMTDFTERSGLSRGGLYRHFASTKEICIALLNDDRENASEELDKAISDQVPAVQLLRFFINQQKQEIQNGGGRLSLAIYEFCLTEVDQREYMEKRFASAVDILARLIRYGQSRQEFGDYDADRMAQHIILFLEGLKLSSCTMQFSEMMIEKQFAMMYQMVMHGKGDLNEKSAGRN